LIIYTSLLREWCTPTSLECLTVCDYMVMVLCAVCWIHNSHRSEILSISEIFLYNGRQIILILSLQGTELSGLLVQPLAVSLPISSTSSKIPQRKQLRNFFPLLQYLAWCLVHSKPGTKNKHWLDEFLQQSQVKWIRQSFV